MNQRRWMRIAVMTGSLIATTFAGGEVIADEEALGKASPGFHVETEFREVTSTNPITGEVLKRKVPVQVYRPNAVGQTPTTFDPFQSREVQGGARFNIQTNPPKIAATISRTSQSSLLQQKYLQAPQGVDREPIKKEIQEALATEFDEMYDAQARQIDDMKNRLDELVKTHDKRAENKDAIITRRLDELIGGPPELRWQTEPIQASSSPYDPVLSFGRFVPSTNSFGQSPVPTDSNARSSLSVPSPIMGYDTPSTSQPSTGSDSAVFEAMRQYTSDKAALDSAENKVQQLTPLREKGLAPYADVSAAKADVQRLKRLVEVDRKSLEYMRQKQHDVIAVAQELLSRDGSLSKAQTAEEERKKRDAQRMHDLIDDFLRHEIDQQETEIVDYR